jgi:hypothetical protein
MWNSRMGVRVRCACSHGGAIQGCEARGDQERGKQKCVTVQTESVGFLARKLKSTGVDGTCFTGRPRGHVVSPTHATVLQRDRSSNPPNPSDLAPPPRCSSCASSRPPEASSTNQPHQNSYNQPHASPALMHVYNTAVPKAKGVEMRRREGRKDMQGVGPFTPMTMHTPSLLCTTCLRARTHCAHVPTESRR